MDGTCEVITFTTEPKGLPRPRIYVLLAFLAALLAALLLLGPASEAQGNMVLPPLDQTPQAIATTTPTVTPTSVCSPVQERYVIMANLSYVPQIVTVTLGTRVRWLNDGPQAHTTTSDTGLWDSGVMNPGEVYSFLFNSPGTYPYHCTLHPDVMTGTVIVLSYCAATATPNTTPSATPTATPTATPVRTATGTRTPTVTPVCSPTTRTVLIIDSGYLPANLTVTLGTTVSWFNEGPSVHTSTSDTGLWDSGNINPGFSYGYTFNSPGTYTYHCAIHPALTGTVNVLSGCSMTTTPTATAVGTSTYTPTRTGTPINTATIGTTATGTRTAATPNGTVTRTETQVATASPSFTVVSTATALPSSTAKPCTIQFSDVPEGSTFYIFIRCLACRSFITGYADGTFRPFNDITRGQIAKIVSNAVGLDEDPGPQIYQDVDSANPFYIWINRLSHRGYMGGYTCGAVPEEPCVGPDNLPYFRPYTNATRGQLAKIVSNAAGLGGDPTGVFYTDVQEDHPFYVWIMRLTTLGVISGYPCGGEGEPCDNEQRPYFRAYNNVTRGQASKIVANTFFPGCSPSTLLSHR
ncbi:MAG TPA: cupredoxin domain-containing protein [Chloroflexia bacterium]|nr:cupredoxin domain-containing protein [Chloroflexia bacterium]